MSYYWYNTQELLQKPKEKYYNHAGKEKAADYYLANKDAIQEKANKYQSLSEKKNKQKENMDKIGIKR